MRPSQINKLYSKLTPHEQVALSFEAAVRRDEAEFDAIIDSVPRVIYQCVHNDFQQRITGLFALAGDYGINYWKTRALMMTALHASDDKDGYDEFVIRFAEKMASMNIALIDICQLIKVDAEAIKTMADCKGQPTFDKYAKTELIEQYTEMFKCVVNCQ
jgi:hypothetical protein